MAKNRHFFELEDRNVTVPSRWNDHVTFHIHRWRARCSCGWIGPNRRTRDEAHNKWVQHFRAGRRVKKVSRTGPRPLTPQDQLPPELRMREP